ncbi:MAG: hypothetical protein JRC86_01920 [Deltaproteobacteria bacterium]|nr:hypothetical protein [Deltaproteobacteria bacterium]
MKVVIGLVLAVLFIALPLYFTLYIFECNILEIMEKGMDVSVGKGENIFPIDDTVRFVRTDFALIFVVVLVLIIVLVVFTLLEVFFRLGNTYIRGCTYNY